MYLLSVIFYSICQKILNIHLCHELHNQCCDPPLGHEANDCVLVTETNLVHVTVILHGVLKCSASWELGFFFHLCLFIYFYSVFCLLSDRFHFSFYQPKCSVILCSNPVHFTYCSSLCSTTLYEI